MLRNRVVASLTLVALVCLAGSCRDSKAPTAPVAGATIAGGDAQTGTVGLQLAKPLTVQVLSVGGTPDSGQAVTFRVISGGGTLSTPTATTDASGLASTQWTLGHVVADSQVVVASMGTDTASSATMIGAFHAQATAGAAQIAAVSGSGQSAAPGAALPDSLLARVADMYGNPIAQTAVNWATSYGSITPASVMSNAQGYASARWTLGSSSGAQTATATANGLTPVSYSATASTGSATIAITVNSPSVNDADGDTLLIGATVTSANQLSTVTATVGGQHVSLTYSQPFQRWVGQLLLAGTPFGAAQLVVAATDVNGASAIKAVAFYHDNPPQLTVTGPLSYSVTASTVHVQATCSNSAAIACTKLTVQVAVGTQPVVASGVSSVDATISLAAYLGQNVSLFFKATDAAGRYADAVVPVEVASVQNMTLVTTVPGMVRDVSGSQVLYVDTTNYRQAIKIHGSGASDITLLDTVTTYLWEAHLSPVGALYTFHYGTDGVLREFRNGTTTTLPAIIGGSNGAGNDSSLVVNGNFATWTAPAVNSGTALMLRDLTAGTSTTVATDAVGGASPAGDIAYSTHSYPAGNQLFFMPHNGTPQVISADTSIAYPGPATDGTRVVYLKEPRACANCSTFQIATWSSSAGEAVLSASTSRLPYLGPNYQINNGWVAYTDLNGGVVQVWTYSPTGTKQQLTFLGTDSYIEGLGASGEVIYSNASTGLRYLSRPPYAATTSLGTTLGTVLWRDGHFVVILGGSVYQVN